jgi:hypothetical protein
MCLNIIYVSFFWEQPVLLPIFPSFFLILLFLHLLFIVKDVEEEPDEEIQRATYREGHSALWAPQSPSIFLCSATWRLLVFVLSVKSFYLLILAVWYVLRN